jgi:HSP20 family protein
MADTQTNRSDIRKQESQGLTRTQRGALQRWDPSFTNPLDFFERMSDEMDRMFDRMSLDFGFPRRSLVRDSLGGRAAAWSPRVEVSQKQDRFVVRAELPGLKKDDVHVELTDDALTIRGERRHEHEEEHDGVFQSEREYGQFLRTIPLPAGVISESARASFRDGVLEIEMQAAPSEANRGRRLEISDAQDTSEKK